MKHSALLTDLYQLTMLQAYWQQGRDAEAVFSLYFRELPAARQYMLAAGLEAVLEYLENFRFADDEIEFLARQARFSQGQLSNDFLEWLSELRFSGDVYAMHEGTPVFADEPLLEVVAPLPQAQIIESLLMNQMHCATVLASKAARIVQAARGRTVLDFALRRMHGMDAALSGARAFYLAGISATSNVLAGQRYGIPVAGTMAHSYIQSAKNELTAFREFAALYPQTVLLVDTYDSLDGVRNVIRLAEELGEDFAVRGIRLDSGNLAELARQSRKILDDAGLGQVQIFVSSGLDEYAIAELVASAAPVDGFGVGTNMGVSVDAPVLELVYKLAEFNGRPTYKTSTGKKTIPGRKQVIRRFEGNMAAGDIVCAADENHDGLPLLHKVMEAGQRLPAGRLDLEASRVHAQRSIAALPDYVRALEATEDYPVEISPRLLQGQE